jgi:adenosyl cobinamide kinase/adenosyl cobinamide phosphate guanylyltransferase
MTTITKIATLLHVAYADELTDELRDIVKEHCADLRRDFDLLHARVRMVEVLEASNKHLTLSRDEARRVARTLGVAIDKKEPCNYGADCNHPTCVAVKAALAYPDTTKETET